MFYPGPNGLIGSMRMVAFLEGMQDHALLSLLGKRDRKRADEIISSIARDIVDYSTSPADFHSARRKLLEALDAPTEYNGYWYWADEGRGRKILRAKESPIISMAPEEDTEEAPIVEEFKAIKEELGIYG